MHNDKKLKMWNSILIMIQRLNHQVTIMGIRHLNKFLRTNCKKSIQCISMSELSGKKIAVDISIYLYKFSGENALMENMYLMMSIFRHYKITPVFIFDGKPPEEKKELLGKRKDDKIKAKTEYERLKQQLEDNREIDPYEKQELVGAMDVLKKKFICIQKNQIQKVKSLIRGFGFTYYDAPGEADELCALLTIKKKVWAALSEDMDLFVYGCTRVLRYFSLVKHNAIIYNTKQIFEELGITEKDFRQICILSGTDYNINSDKNVDLYSTLKWFKKYHKRRNNSSDDFYNWLHENTNYIQDCAMVDQIYKLFDIHENNDSIASFENVKISNGPYNKIDIQELLKEEGFLF